MNTKEVRRAIDHYYQTLFVCLVNYSTKTTSGTDNIVQEKDKEKGEKKEWNRRSWRKAGAGKREKNKVEK